MSRAARASSERVESPTVAGATWAVRWRYLTDIATIEPDATLLWQTSNGSPFVEVPPSLQSLFADHRSVDSISDLLEGLDAAAFSGLVTTARNAGYACTVANLRHDRGAPINLHVVVAPEFGAETVIGVLARVASDIAGAVVDLRAPPPLDQQQTRGDLPFGDDAEPPAWIEARGEEDLTWQAINEAALNFASDLGQRHFLALSSSLPHGVIQLDSNLVVLHTNTRLREILGSPDLSYSWPEAQARVHPDDQAVLNNALASTLVDRCEPDVKLRVFREDDGSERLCRVRGCPVIEDDRVVGVVASVEDVTDVTELHDQLERQARTDDLTGLANRNTLLLALNESLESQSRAPMTQPVAHAVIFVDLDGFKRVNDEHGHHVGDAVLVEIGRRIEALASPGKLVARLGGDEFVLACIYPESTERLVSLALVIHDSICGPIDVDGVIVRVGASIGLALSEHSDDSGRLLTNADLAMYQSKRSSERNITVYRPSMRQAIKDQLELARAVETAGANDEFTLHFQPVVDPRTGLLVGAESLVRWNHIERGQLLADDFMSAADESGASRAIAAWAIDNVCGVAVRYREVYGSPIRWAVHLTRRQLASRDLPETVFAAVDRHGLTTEDIVFDVSGLALRDHGSRAVDTLQLLSAAGFAVSFGDFGVASLSLSAVRDPVIDIVKVHPRFTAELADSAESRLILEFIIGLCRSQRKAVIVNGIEDERQLEIVTSLGIGLVQGDLLLPTSSVQDVLAGHPLWRPRPPRDTASTYG